MRFLIMRRHPMFIADDQSEIELSDRSDGGQLLRLLLLARDDDHRDDRQRGQRGRPLETHTIASQMPALKPSRTTRVGEPIKQSAVWGQKSNLEKLIGDTWIQTDGDCYRIDVEADDVDAFAFERQIDALGVLQMHDVEDADPSVLDALRDLKAMWAGNPVEPFSDTDLEFLAVLHRSFQRAYDRLRFALVYALLQRGEHGDLGEAVSLLTAMATSSKSATDPEIWSLLVRAHGSLPTYREDVNAVLRMIEAQEGSVPEQIEVIANSVLSREADLLFGAAGPSAGARQSAQPGGVADSPASDALQKIAREVGISADGSTLRLQGSRTDPISCIEATNRRLYFSGVFAGKWVESRYVRTRLDLLLSRLDEDGMCDVEARQIETPGEDDEWPPVRFLVLDPESESYERYCALTQSAESPESIPYLRELAATHAAFDVRLFDSLPTFRIVILDDDVVSVSPYLLKTYDHVSGHQGWDAAHVALSPFAPWSLARSFEALFLEQWRIARPIEELS